MARGCSIAVSVLLLSTYDLGRQPFGLASPAAWLRRAGVDVVTCDLSREPLDRARCQRASLVAFYLPMHTATRLALPVIDRVRALNPPATLCRVRAVRAAQPSPAARARRVGRFSARRPRQDLVALAQRGAIRSRRA